MKSTGKDTVKSDLPTLSPLEFACSKRRVRNKLRTLHSAILLFSITQSVENRMVGYTQEVCNEIRAMNQDHGIN